jgi:hypothetical protein
MKKFTILALAALLVVAFTVPAAAFESQFGGYWRTRFYVNKEFSGDDSGDKDWTVVDTRTRLYYTAVLNDNLKFVNKWEWNATWGQNDVGDVGLDSTTSMRWKNSYIDTNVWNVNWKIGLQGTTISRGFLFSDDFAGVIAQYKGDMFTLPVYWIKAYDASRVGNFNTYDIDYYGTDPRFKIGGVSLSVPIFYAYTNNASNPDGKPVWDVGPTGGPFDKISAWYFGLNADFNVGPGSLWFSGLFNTGSAYQAGTNQKNKLKGYLLAGGGSFDVGPVDIHGEIFYATGDDDPTDTDADNYLTLRGESYYWAEIMGYGVFDKQFSNNSVGDEITDIVAGNIGVGFKPMAKLKAVVDLWYAQRDKDIKYIRGDGTQGSSNELGWEIDAKLTYEVIDNLNLDLVGAYLIAGDATTEEASDNKDPWEVGARLSLSF